MRKHYSLSWVLLTVLLGALMGSAIGQVLGLILPTGVVRDFFLRSVTFGFSPVTIDLSLITLTLGFMFQLNIVGVIGIVLAAYILRWYI